MAGKPFDAALYEQDDGAKHVVISMLEGRRFVAWVNEDDFGVDVLAERDGLRWQFEVEVKHGWRGPVFPFPSLHYAARKLKWADHPRSWYCTLNEEWDRMLLVSGEVLMSCAVVVKDTIYTQAEAFVEVPLEECWLVVL
ncbi:MAG: hypothetical protein EBT75_01340 [Proteobacteria bacterium]|nr:hypothetical protein [Pseudomonadota bacterium]NBS49294.1 hypothetical protein [Verrucomicrobiota bacterium]